MSDMNHHTIDIAEITDVEKSDKEADFEITDNFERFNQKNDVFRRSWWDANIRSEKSRIFYASYRKPLKNWRQADGFTQKDYAFRNATWHVSDLFTEMKENEDRREGFSDAFTLYRDVAKEKTHFDSPKAAADEIKNIAKRFGADIVGITQYDERWLYTQKFSDMSLTERPNDIPDGLKYVIVTAQKMDYDLISTVPSALSGAATGLGYSHDATVVLSVAQYLRNLGYNAVASMNDSSLNIPMAIQAGLGEYGRHGLLITKEFGPRVRLGKIYTDLPMTLDKPLHFGVKEFCDICRGCTKGCPVKAISDGAPTTQTYNQSNIKGIKKWTVNGEKCFGYWAAQNSDCSVCIRVCPYNKDYSKWLYQLGRWLAGTRLRRFMLTLDIKLGYGKRKQPKLWWQGQRQNFNNFIRNFFSSGKQKKNNQKLR